jgi:hypothetical protein
MSNAGFGGGETQPAKELPFMLSAAAISSQGIKVESRLG